MKPYLGHRLTTVVNLIDGASQQYGYERQHDIHPVVNDETVRMPVLRVVARTAADEGETRFTYLGDRGLVPVETRVRDARLVDTRYQMDRYGAAHSIIAPHGTRQTGWDPATLKPAVEHQLTAVRKTKLSVIRFAAKPRCFPTYGHTRQATQPHSDRTVAELASYARRRVVGGSLR